MTFALAATLLVLALVDSTSFGTLLIPVWLLLAPGRVRAGRVLLFLGTVAAFYLLVGLALLLGLGAALAGLVDLLETPWAVRAQLALGIGMLVLSLLPGRRRQDSCPGRLTRWRERATGGAGAGGLVALALTAALVEVATMLPYLGAIGLLLTSDLAPWARVTTLAGYCLVMVLPALVLLAARVLAHRFVQPVLERLSRSFERTGPELTAWVVGIVGFLLARDAVARMPELLDLLG